MGIDSKDGADPSRHRELSSEPVDFRVSIADSVSGVVEEYIRSGSDGLVENRLAQETRERLGSLHAIIAGADLPQGAKEVFLTARAIDAGTNLKKQTSADVMHRALYERFRDNDDRYKVGRQDVDLIADPQEIAGLSEAKALLAKVLRAKNQAIKIARYETNGYSKIKLVFVDPKYPNCLVKIEVTKVADTGSGMSSERMMLVMYEPSVYQAEMAKLQVEVDERKQMELAQAAKAQAERDELALAEARNMTAALVTVESQASTTVALVETEESVVSDQPKVQAPNPTEQAGRIESAPAPKVEEENVEPKRTLNTIARELAQLPQDTNREMIFARAIAMAGNLADRNAFIIQHSLQKLKAIPDDRAFADKLKTKARPLYEELISRKMIG